MRFIATCILLLASGISSFAQVTTARLDGTVTDPSGAVVPGAQVVVIQTSTDQTFRVSTDEKGYWAIASVPSGVYKVTVTHEGFKAGTAENVKMDAGVPATLNIGLTVGATNETVEVTAGVEIIQTDSATVSSTLQGTQIHDLPFTSHNATELIATQPGTQTALAVRNSVVNGMPQTSINITMDGVNIQDNAAKSNPDAVFNAVQPRADAIEEMTMTTSAAGADSTGEGGVQIKFVTRAGTNQFHGSLYETNRNRWFEANYYFNGLTNTPKDLLNLNEFGGRIGGPVLKNKVFFFTNFEAFRLPQSFPTNSTWLTPSAINGIFTYNANGAVRTVNLYSLAAAANASLPAGTRAFPTAGDPTLAKVYSTINGIISGGQGTLQNRIATNNDYNRQTFSWQDPALNNRNFETTRLDYNITEKHHFNIVWNYQTNLRNPDGLNGTLAILPGQGTVLGGTGLDAQKGIAFTGAIGLRSVLTSRLTNEFTGGLQGGTTALGAGLSPADYGLFKGYIVQFIAGTSYIQNPYYGNYTGFAPRNSPVKQFTDNLSWLKGSHVLNFGGNFTQVNLYQAAANSSLIQTAVLGYASGDPANTGATSLFTTTNFPGASATQLSDAGNLYAILTGRVASLTSSSVLGEKSKTYGPNFSVDRDQQREFGLFIQDSWRLSPNLTLNYGLRWDKQNPFQNLSGIYTSVGLAGLYGVSGVGNLFKPGVQTGSYPVYNISTPGQEAYISRNGNFSPSIGIAYKLPKGAGPLHWLTGDEAVVRGGFSIATLREGMFLYSGVLGANQGRTLSTSVDPVNFPANFGAPGSVNFSDPVFPSRAPTSIDPSFPNPSFPLPYQSGSSVNDFNPSIKPEYVESWNLSFQRALDKNTVVDVRYVGNHSVNIWSSVNLNEVNTVENGFASQFQAAENNLAIANGISVAQLPGATLKTNNYGNQGLPGQVALPVFQAALGTACCTDQTTVTQLQQGVAGATANAFNTAARVGNMVKAGYPVNYFVANPIFANANEETNRGNSTYNAAQVEVRRRLASGLQVQGSYVFAKSLTNANNLTLRQFGGFKGPTNFDIRNGFKFTWIYQLPVGRGRSFLGSAHGIVGKVVEGWEMAGVGRLQSGTPINILSGRNTFNQNDGGVVLHNITTSELQGMMHPYGITSQISAAGLATGAEYYLPRSLVNNTLAAFQISGTLDPNAPYIGPCTTAGQICDQLFLYGPWVSKWDVSMVKRTQIRERVNFEFRCQALNVFNHPNVLLPGGGGNVTVGSSFGQTTTAFRDTNNTNDPGSRTLEFVFRLNF